LVHHIDGNMEEHQDPNIQAQPVEQIQADTKQDYIKAKEAEAGSLELGQFDSNPSIDILPGGRLPGESDDTRFATTRKELWSYYAYYVGNNGR
jgi:hypothetical protein